MRAWASQLFACILTEGLRRGPTVRCSPLCGSVSAGPALASPTDFGQSGSCSQFTHKHKKGRFSNKYLGTVSGQFSKLSGRAAGAARLGAAGTQHEALQKFLHIFFPLLMPPMRDVR